MANTYGWNGSTSRHNLAVSGDLTTATDLGTGRLPVWVAVAQGEKRRPRRRRGAAAASRVGQTAPPRPMLRGRMMVSSRPGPTAMNFTRVLVNSAMYWT